MFFLGCTTTLGEDSSKEQIPAPPVEVEDISDISGPPRYVRAILPGGTKETVGGGKPGRDFPVLNSVPRTDFSCAGLIPGYYADESTGCQVRII